MVTASEYKIHLEGIRFRGRHGVTESERNLPQDFLVTLHVALPVSELPEGDNMRQVFDYDRLSVLVVEEGTAQEYKLLETLASRVIARVLKDTPATWVRVAVTKHRPPTTHSTDSVTVELAGRREGASERVDGGLGAAAVGGLAGGSLERRGVVAEGDAADR